MGLERKEKLQIRTTIILLTVVFTIILAKTAINTIPQSIPTAEVVKEPQEETEPAKPDDSITETNTEKKNSEQEEPKETITQTSNSQNSEMQAKIPKSHSSSDSESGGNNQQTLEELSQPQTTTSIERTITKLENNNYQATLEICLKPEEDFLVIDETIPEDATIIDAGTGNTNTPQHLKWVFTEKPTTTQLTYTININQDTDFSGVFATNTISLEDIQGQESV